MSIPLPQPGKPDGPAKPAGSIDYDQFDTLEEKVVAAAKQVYDPEIPVSIYELGLIYKIDADVEKGHVHVDMTLTSANCPEAQSLPAEVRQEIKSIPGVETVDVKIVWEPAWTKEMMSEAAQLHLGLL